MSPQTTFTAGGLCGSVQACGAPYTWAIGQEYRTPLLSGAPTPNAQQWQQIVAELEPAFTTADFHRSANSTREDNDSYSRDDGAFVELRNGSGGSPVTYRFSTGCRMPTAWRTAPPPPDTDASDAKLHYPYLFGSPGGRTVAPG